jgi:hypothetical protein
MGEIRGCAQDLACSFTDPNMLKSDVGTNKCISKIWQVGDLSDEISDIQQSKIIAD